MDSKNKNDIELRAGEDSKEHHEDAQLAANTQVPGPIPFAAWLIIVTELCERFAFYGASMMFQRYMLTYLVLGKGTATAISRGFSFFSYITTIVGAVVADKWLGKFKTILIFSILYTIGLSLLTVSAVPSLKDSSMPLFIVALYCAISWGTGGIKSNVSAFAAEQVPSEDYADPNTPGVTINHGMTVERIFRYFYMAINVGGMLGQAITPSVSKSAGWATAFLIPTIVFVVGIIIFALGRSKYYDRPPNGNILGKTFRCLAYAFRHRSARAPGTHWIHAAMSRDSALEWDDKFVLDLERTYHACKVFCVYPVYWALYNNMNDNFINMAINMTRPSWLQPEQLSFVNSAVIVIFIPILDIIVFPILRKMGFRLGPINRIIIGFTIVTGCFVYVTLLQHFVYQSAPYYDFTGRRAPMPPPDTIAINNIEIWWQLPAYIFIGISEIFASATGLEFAFRSAAPELKSVVMSLFLATNAFGALIGMILAIWSNDPNFVWLYMAQAICMAVLTVLFAWKFAKLDNEV
ncbi:hypothetical protein DFQ26_005165 [Actinomortierella ambigua]|nr:hypothetical protein DFQ26_005165 [Actinomortierella ambigua]